MAETELIKQDAARLSAAKELAEEKAKKEDAMRKVAQGKPVKEANNNLYVPQGVL